MSEFNLSEKRFQTEEEFFKDNGNVLYNEKDVKEFIRRDWVLIHLLVAKKIDFREYQIRKNKLAGDKLKC